MATLYTPAPQREGLDWLGGMVRDAQQLWQNQAKIAQQAKNLELQRQQQKMQEEHFWVEQARLKGQEDFQNRKFLYGMKQDEVTNAMAEKRYGLDEQRAGYEGRRVTADEKRLDAALDPNSPDNQYRSALTESARANAEKDRAEIDYKFGPKSPSPKVTTWWYGETGTSSDFLNAFGKGINKGYVDKDSLALSPDQERLVRSQGVKPGDWLRVKLDDQSVVRRRWDDRTSDKLTGRWDFHGGDRPDPRDGKRVVGFQLENSKDDFVPVGGQRTGAPPGQIPQPPPGSGLEVTNVQVDAQGRPTNVNFGRPQATRNYADPLETQLLAENRTLATLTNSLQETPAYPKIPAGRKNISKEEGIAYENKVKDIERANAPIRAQVEEITRRTQETRAKLNLRGTVLNLENTTPKFKEQVAEEFAMAVKSSTPAAALRELRPKIEALAKAGDPSALEALKFIDAKVPGAATAVAKPKEEAKAPADLFKK